MTEHEIELIKMIRENDNPAHALTVATFTLMGYLKQHESSEAPSVVAQQELA